jgi:hypothetical protein
MMAGMPLTSGKNSSVYDMASLAVWDVNAARIRFQEALEYRGSVQHREARDATWKRGVAWGP